jgi:hypothetical protein
MSRQHHVKRDLLSVKRDLLKEESPIQQGDTTSNLPHAVSEVAKRYKDIASDEYRRVAAYRADELLSLHVADSQAEFGARVLGCDAVDTLSIRNTLATR